MSNRICSLSGRQIFSEVQLWLMPCSTAEVLTPTTREFTILQADGSGLKVPTTAACPVRKADLTSLTCSHFSSSLICPLDPCSQRERGETYIQSKEQAQSSYLGFLFFLLRVGLLISPKRPPPNLPAQTTAFVCLLAPGLNPAP